MKEIYLESFEFETKQSATLGYSSTPISPKKCLHFVIERRHEGALPVFIARNRPKPSATLETFRCLMKLPEGMVYQVESDAPIAMVAVRFDDEKKLKSTFENEISKGLARDVCFIDSKLFHMEVEHLKPKVYRTLLRRIDAAVHELSASANKALEQLGKPDRLDAAREDRDALLKSVTWFDSAKVAQLAGASAASNPAQHASHLRREKRLFGVRYKAEYKHPDFQFRNSGDVHPAIARLLQFLPSTDANWTAAFWLFQPHGKFGGKCPAEVFQDRPDDVVDAAREDFVTGPYEGEVVMPQDVARHGG